MFKFETVINKIVAEIAQNKDFERICKTLIKGDEWQDLWHDVIIKLYDKESYLIKAKEGGYLFNYVVSIIYNKFGDECREKSKNIVSLYNYKDWLNDDTEENLFLHWQSKEYENFKRTELEEKAVEVTKEAVSEVTKMMLKGDSGAMVLWQASQTNVYSVSKRLGTSSYQINKTIKPIIKQIKNKLK